jgi:hypothetical protein
MIRFILRILGWWILAAGFVFFVYDGTKSIAGDHWYITKLVDVWNALSAGSLQVLQSVIQQHAAAWLWDPVIQSVLTAPTWVVFVVLGAILMLLGRKKKPLIGYTR